MTLKKIALLLLLTGPAAAWPLAASALDPAAGPEKVDGNAPKQPNQLAEADSLFEAGQLTAAAARYRAQVWRQQRASPRLLLRLAYAEQQLGRPAAALLYLSMAQARQPRPGTWRQLAALAARRRLVGYPDTWQQELRVQWEHYYYLGLQGLLGGAVVGLVVLLLLRRRAGAGSWGALAAYTLLTGLYLELLRPAPAALVVRPGAALMAGPAAAAAWLSTASVGDRLLVLGRQDIWCRVRWQEREVFIRAADVLEVE